MSRIGTARTRHIRHRHFERMSRSDTPNDFYTREAVDLAATGAAVVFTTTFAANTLTKATHGLSAGEGPFILTTVTTLPAGLSLTARYWMIIVDANTLQLALSREAARLGVAEVFTDDGTGDHSYAKAAEIGQDVFEINSQGVRPNTIAQATDVDDL